jgi:glycosyltransferase involved in cell wall biosynthesis
MGEPNVMTTELQSVGSAPPQISRHLNVVFVTIADLPEGGGNTTRLRTLATAVAGCGHRVLLLNQHGLGVAPRNMLKAAGTIGAIEYRYVLGCVERQFGFNSFGTKLRAVVALVREISALHSRSRIDVLWFNNLSFYDTYPLTRLAKRLGISTIQSYEDERLELVVPQRSVSSKVFGLNSRLADHYCPRMADAVIVISQYLASKYARLGKTPLRVHLVPTIVNCDYWNVGPEPFTATPTLLYAGCFSEQDEIHNMLVALANLRERGRRFRLVVLGGENRDPRRVPQIISAIQLLGLNDVIQMRGFVPLDEVRKAIADANILLNIRRDGIWSRSGLSTKLSEYLASGRAVVCTDLGDVSRYVKHQESAILVPPSTTAEQIADAIDQCLTSPALRMRLGIAGRDVAKRCFDIQIIKAQIDKILQSTVG